MEAPMTPREAVAWLVENTAATRKTYCIILRSTNGVHNPGTRGMLICQAAELAGRLHAYRESLHHMMQAGMIPADLLDDVKEVLKSPAATAQPFAPCARGWGLSPPAYTAKPVQMATSGCWTLGRYPAATPGTSCASVQSCS